MAATSSGRGGSIAARPLTFSSRDFFAPDDAGVVARARADPEVLGRGDLDVVDVVAVPDRLEHVVREPERHHVLDRLLAQGVVDAEDLALAEDRVHDLPERAGG